MPRRAGPAVLAAALCVVLSSCLAVALPERSIVAMAVPAPLDGPRRAATARPAPLSPTEQAAPAASRAATDPPATRTPSPTPTPTATETATPPPATAAPPTPTPAPTATLPPTAEPSPTPSPTFSPTPEPPPQPQCQPTAQPGRGMAPGVPRLRPPAHTADGRPVAYLTFDDGPHEPTTPQILDLLARYGARATFFVLGQSVERFPDLTRTIAEAGHSVQNHTANHVRLNTASDEVITSEVETAQALIAEATGVVPFCVRPPGGVVDVETQEILAGLGLQVALWDVDPQDWRRPEAATIATHALERIFPGAIVLLHDGGGDRTQTVAALETILASLTADGYVLEALAP